MEIDYMNKKRNIPYELSEEEKLLYGYTQGITLKQLEEMKEKYNNMQTEGQISNEMPPMQPEGESEILELPLLSRG